MTQVPTPSEWQSITALFDRLVDVSAERQAAALKNARLSDDVVARVRAMLDMHGRTGMLDTGAAIPRQPRPEPGYSSLAEGAEVGAFRVIQLIGRGGMGEVYL